MRILKWKRNQRKASQRGYMYMVDNSIGPKSDFLTISVIQFDVGLTNLLNKARVYEAHAHHCPEFCDDMKL